jgi:hypothetical protein
MKFWDYQDGFSTLKTRLGRKFTATVDQFYEKAIDIGIEAKDPFVFRHASLEHTWQKCQKPYYNIWPAIYPLFRTVKLDIPCSAIHAPYESILLRLPESSENNFLRFGKHSPRTILFGHQEVAASLKSKELARGLVMAVDFGETGTDGSTVYTLKLFPLRDDLTVDEAANVLPFHESWREGLQIPQHAMTELVRLCCCVCLLGEDPELITPDVLSKDRAAFQLANAEYKKVIVDRAKRRGKHGFHVGQSVEQSPHYRRAHLATVWTGKGRQVAKIVLRKGAVVHRNKLSQVPTGFRPEDA